MLVLYRGQAPRQDNSYKVSYYVHRSTSDPARNKDKYMPSGLPPTDEKRNYRSQDIVADDVPSSLKLPTLDSSQLFWLGKIDHLYFFSSHVIIKPI